MAAHPPASSDMSDPRHERAQVMVETAIVFPVQMIITLAIMQYCLIAGAKQIVNYAAHTAARAVLVGEDPNIAAAIVCSPIAGTYLPAGAASKIYIPGRGYLARSDRSQLKTFVEVLNPVGDGDKLVKVRVTHYFQLIVPFVEYTPFIDWSLLWGQVAKLGPDHVVHKVITQTMTMPHMWDDDLTGVVGHEIIPDLSADDSTP